MSRPLSRRAIIGRAAALGGAGAAYGAMSALGLTGDTAWAKPRVRPGEGRRVAILGAGIAGLTAAYELERAGWIVTMLEARERVGGRNWTIRRGDVVSMLGEADQVCDFAPGQYFNAGPARIPSIHTHLLDYCRTLGVPLEVEINASRGAWLGPEGSRPVRMRQAVNDTRGWLSELLAKAVNRGALDGDLSLEEREKLLPFLRHYGDLGEDYAFRGTARSGLKSPPGAELAFAEAVDPLPLRELLANEQLSATVFEDNIFMQATMFQPVGGMDRIAAGFERALSSPLHRGAEVTAIEQSADGVTIRWRSRGREQTLVADYAIVTIPLPVLARIPAKFSPAVASAIASVPYDHSNKVAFEAPRFWEKDQIYGGISFVGGETALVWYPTADVHAAARGVLVATYNAGPRAAAFAGRPLAEQIRIAAAVVDRLHPGQAASLSKALTVNWAKIPYNLGAWPNWNPEGGRQESRNDSPAYRLLCQPDGRVYFAGAHLSQTPGWQEGAIQSAHRTIRLMSERVAA